MACGRAGKQCTNGLDRLAGPTYDPADVAGSKLEFEDDRSAAGNFREHHVIPKFDQLANDKLEKFSHCQKLTTDSPSHNGYGVTTPQIFPAANDEHYVCAERL
jgi:hypothetical protein